MSEFHPHATAKRLVRGAAAVHVACVVALCVLVMHGCSTGPTGSAAAPSEEESALEPFAGGRIESINGVSISADGQRAYATVWRDEPASPRQGRRAEIVVHSWGGGEWSRGRTAPFSGEFDDAEAFESHDGQWVYFASRRPIPGTSRDWLEPNIWRCKRLGPDEWSEPEFLTAVNVIHAYDGYPCVTRDGSLYFSSTRAGGAGDVDIYVSRLVGGKHARPTPVTRLNSEWSDNDAYISTDGAVAIFTRNRDTEHAQIDLFLSLNLGSGWRTPIPIESVNQPGWNLSPNLTPDRRWLVFNAAAQGEVVQVEWPVEEFATLARGMASGEKGEDSGE